MSNKQPKICFRNLRREFLAGEETQSHQHVGGMPTETSAEQDFEEPQHL